MKSDVLMSRRIGVSILNVVWLLVAACTLIEPHREIFGNWRAEQLSLGGVGLPISPNLQFESAKAMIGGQAIPVESYLRDGNRITVHLKGAPTLSFEMQGQDAMTLEVPLIGKIRYARVK